MAARDAPRSALSAFFSSAAFHTVGLDQCRRSSAIVGSFQTAGELRALPSGGGGSRSHPNTSPQDPRWTPWGV
eukprot:1194185-Prorocentrum_minimum.AAC.1